MLARPALACALAALVAAAALPASAGPAPAVVHGRGTATYDNFTTGLHCAGFVLDVEIAGPPGALVVQIQAITQDPVCLANSYLYSVNPYVVEGNPQQGWVGEAVGVQCVPVCAPEVPLVWPVWPLWPISMLPTGNPGEYWLWSFYEDVNGRQYLLEGAFTVDLAV